MALGLPTQPPGWREESEMTEEERTRVETRLGDQVICQGCGATLDTYAERCDAPLDVRCEGFRTVEAARTGAAS